MIIVSSKQNVEQRNLEKKWYQHWTTNPAKWNEYSLKLKKEKVENNPKQQFTALYELYVPGKSCRRSTHTLGPTQTTRYNILNKINNFDLLTSKL